MTQTERQKNITRFIDRWSCADYKEDGSTAPFWIDLLEKVLGVPHATDLIKFEETFKREQKGNPLYCDAWIPTLHIIIEQKAPGVPLDSSYERHGRTFQSAYEQAFEYDQTLAVSERSRYIITSNFREIWIYDMDVREADRAPVKILLQDLAKDYKKLAILTDGNTRLSDIVEVEVSVEAGEKVGRLYDTLLAEYKTKIGDVPPAMLHALNVLCVRIVFCLYAEDAGLFAPDAFARYIESYRAENARTALIELFKILDKKKDERDPFLADNLASFPYVNGGLFHDMDIPVPPISEETRNFLIHDMSRGFDWSKISPTIFGAVFESTLNPETRRKGGMHYTSVENIHKVIDPLFLDDLRQKVDSLIHTPEDEKYTKGRNEITLKTSYEKRLRALQDQMAAMTFLDPACGSGNFLTETFLSLRRLENKIISELFGGDTGTSALLDADYIRVSITQFHGIEINDFAVTVAKTALWIAESQMLRETEKLVRTDLDFLPLKTNANIVEGNALTLDWEDVIPKTELNYIMGNPPFVGARIMDKKQKAELLSIFDGVKNAGNLDYVACWYNKATDFMRNTAIRAAFVSTNSICQGEQVAILWKDIFAQGFHIDFAYRTFIWDSEANLKAHVHCVIVGFSSTPNRNPKRIYETVTPEIQNKNATEPKRAEERTINEKITFEKRADEKQASEKQTDENLIEGKTKIKITEAANINGYLVDAVDVFIESRTKPLCDVPPLLTGSQRIDNDYFMFTNAEKEDFIKIEPSSSKYFRLWYGADEFINNRPRWCLFLGNCQPGELRAMPQCCKIIQNVQNYRLSSKRTQTIKAADYPNKFGLEVIPDSNYMIVPVVSSERRRYVPIGFMSPDVLCSNQVNLIPGATLYHFGVLTSNVHMAWMRTVAGRLKSDYRYSKDIVYNNFPWPNPTDEQKQKIERTAQAILDARARYPESSLADLYDPLTMPADLQKAHRENDRAVFEAYGKSWDITSEPACIAYLMQAYRKLTEN